MEKLKKLWINNKIVIILGAIVLICIILILVVMIKYFVGTGLSNYGNRLEATEENPYTEENQNNYISSLSEETTLTNTSITVMGNIIYIKLTFTGTSLDNAKTIASNSIEYIDEEFRLIYDINFTVYQEDTTNDEGTSNGDGFLQMASYNSSGSGLIWTNNTATSEE